MKMERRKIIIVMKHDITFYPPVISVCKILYDLSCDIVYIGACSDSNIEKELLLFNVKVYKQPQYGGNGVKRFLQQLQFRERVKRIIEKEYFSDNSLLWLVHFETVVLFSSFLKKYDTVAHLLEFRDSRLKLAYKLLNPFRDFIHGFSYAKKIICCEYNRALITKYLFNLSTCPIVLPNKPYENGTLDNFLNLPQDVSTILSKYENKKIILYQGGFHEERKLDDFMRAMELLPEDYVLMLMGPNNSYFKLLKGTYENERIVFMPFLPPPLHLEVTKYAYIGILSYTPIPYDIGMIINALYCAPNKLYEYAKFQIPMISNNVPALKDAFTTYKAGICIEELTVENICKAVKEIGHDYEGYVAGTRCLYNGVNLEAIVKSAISI